MLCIWQSWNECFTKFKYLLSAGKDLWPVSFQRQPERRIHLNKIGLIALFSEGEHTPWRTVGVSYLEYVIQDLFELVFSGFSGTDAVKKQG